MKYLKYAIPYIMFMVSAILFTAATDQLVQVCDIEGSACSDDTHCCEQSICDTVSIPEKVEDIPTEKRPKTKCCDKEEFEKKPLPDHCSKCPMCSDAYEGKNRTGITSSLWWQEKYKRK